MKRLIQDTTHKQRKPKYIQTGGGGEGVGRVSNLE